MSKSNYNWLVLFSDYSTKIVGAQDVQGALWEIDHDKQEEVTAIIRQELS